MERDEPGGGGCRQRPSGAPAGCSYRPGSAVERELPRVLYLLFFFSSRRPHTRYIGDWSSDVCSSDLQHGELLEQLKAKLPSFGAEEDGSISRTVERDKVKEVIDDIVGASRSLAAAVT